MNLFNGITKTLGLLAIAACMIGGTERVGNATTYITDCSSITGGTEYYYIVTSGITNGCNITGVTYTGGIIVDLNGHTISGTVTATGRPDSDTTYWLHGNSVNVTLTGGTISGKSVYWDCNGHGGWSANVNYTSPNGEWWTKQYSNCNGMIVSGTIVSGVYYSVWTNSAPYFGVNMTNSSIRYIKIDDTYTPGGTFFVGWGIYASGDYNDYHHNLIIGGGSNLSKWDDCFVFQGAHSTIHDNVCTDWPDMGFEYSGTNGSTPARVVDFTIDNNTYNGPGTLVGCLYTGCDADGLKVTNNTYTGYQQLFEMIGYGTGIFTNAVIKNNYTANTMTNTSQIGDPTLSSFKFYSSSNNEVTGNHFGGDVRVNTSGFFDGGTGSVHNYCSSVLPWYAWICY